jgi:hypothetical protein
MERPHHVPVVQELIARGVNGQRRLETVVLLTGLPPLQAMQVIACECGFDIRDAVGMSLEPALRDQEPTEPACDS